MKVTLRTVHLQTVVELLREENLLLGAKVTEDRCSLTLEYANEDYLVELRGWCAAAVVCRLIYGLEIAS